MTVQGLKLTLAPPVWRLLSLSYRVNRWSPPPNCGPGPFIFACLHRDILPAIIHVKPARPVLLVSQSPDGDILVRTLGTTDYGFVRGATGEDGSRALVALRRVLAGGRSIGLAVDGPKGPYGVVQPGVLKLASLTQASILPLIAQASRAVQLRTWDRTLVPWPLSRVRILAGRPLHLPPDASVEHLQRAGRGLTSFFSAAQGRPA